MMVTGITGKPFDTPNSDTNNRIQKEAHDALGARARARARCGREGYCFPTWYVLLYVEVPPRKTIGLAVY